MSKHRLRDRRVLALLTLTIVLAAFWSAAALASSPSPVKISDDFFGPKKLTIHKGNKVTWKWEGVLPHNVKVRTGPSKFSSRIQVSGSFSHTFTKKGTYYLYCVLHPKMKMTIVVR